MAADQGAEPRLEPGNNGGDGGWHGGSHGCAGGRKRPAIADQIFPNGVLPGGVLKYRLSVDAVAK